MKKLAGPLRVTLAVLVAASGCRVNKYDCSFYDSAACPSAVCGPAQLSLEEPVSGCEIESVGYEEPAPLDPNGPLEYRDIALEEAITHALQHAKIMRDLGATLLSAPGQQRTVYDPAMQFSDPLSGEEAALAAFDANFAARAFFDNNDREFNNTFVGTNGYLKQDLGNYGAELRKRAATGSQMVLRHTVDYDFNNNIGNRFGNPSGEYQALVDAEVRHPLLLGSGVMFNRIAGPGSQPGQLNGVLLARVRTDISLADFETAVRDLVANVENAYWDLYFAYRDLDAKKRARDLSLETYTAVAAQAEKGLEKGTAENLGQALEQYWRYESEVVNAQNGRTTDGTRTSNGAQGGASRTPVGVRQAERRLRLVLGMPINGGPLLRPADEPVVAPVSFDWPTLVAEAVSSRPELRRQRWRVKQRELELIANRKFLLPSLDAVARYRYRGFGDQLLSQADASANDPFPSAYGNLADGRYQEWQLGVELEVPLGFRRGHAAVRNAEHALARERVILAEQKRDVLFGLSNAAADVQRAHGVVKAQYNRFQAAAQQIAALKKAEESGRLSVDIVLEAQQRLLDTEVLYHQARVDYMLALRNVHFEKGSLLAYNSIFLNEGASPGEAYCDAAELADRRLRPMDYVCRDAVVSRGRVAQGMAQEGFAPASLPVMEAAPAALPTAAEPAAEPLPPAPTSQGGSAEGSAAPSETEDWGDLLSADS